jgi:hypothetical protein
VLTTREHLGKGGFIMGQEALTRANVFELFGESIQVSYSSPNVLGGPRLSYRDAQRSLVFQGNDIRSQNTEFGEVITVTLEAIPDFRTVTFTLILPVVTVMFQGSGTYIRVPGVTATNPTTLGGPPQVQNDSMRSSCCKARPSLS